MNVIRLSALLFLLLLRPASAESEIPTTAWGTPDFSGTWAFGSLTPLERPDELAGQSHFSHETASAFEEEFDANLRKQQQEFAGDKYVGADLWLDFGTYVEPDLRTSRIIDPPDGKIPPKTEVATKRAERGMALREEFSGPEVLMLPERCIIGNVAYVRAPDNNYVMMVHTPQAVGMLHEFADSLRTIWLDGRPRSPQQMRYWLGESRGRWDGETLVVTTTHFRPDYSLEGSGPNMVLMERFTLSGPDELRYEFTVIDPESFVAPWTALTYMRRAGDQEMLYEYACHEGNRSMGAILRGSRILEAEARARTDEEAG